MCAKHFLHCSIKKVITPLRFIFSRFIFLASLVLPWQQHFIKFFLKSSLLFEIFLVEVKKNILSTFVSFLPVSRRISLGKGKMSLKRNKTLCSKYPSVHKRTNFRDFPSWTALWNFLATHMTKNYKI